MIKNTKQQHLQGIPNQRDLDASEMRLQVTGTDVNGAGAVASLLLEIKMPGAADKAYGSGTISKHTTNNKQHTK